MDPPNPSHHAHQEKEKSPDHTPLGTVCSKMWKNLFRLSYLTRKRHFMVNDISSIALVLLIIYFMITLAQSELREKLKS